MKKVRSSQVAILVLNWVKLFFSVSIVNYDKSMKTPFGGYLIITQFNGKFLVQRCSKTDSQKFLDYGADLKRRCRIKVENQGAVTRRCSVKIGFLKNFTKFTGNACVGVSFLIKLKKKLQRRCFSVSFAKFLQTYFS